MSIKLSASQLLRLAEEINDLTQSLLQSRSGDCFKVFCQRQEGHSRNSNTSVMIDVAWAAWFERLRKNTY